MDDNTVKTKPRASRAGTRNIATLTKEQLNRKRANDREAQRAKKQRTTQQIERLEKRINELQDPDFDMAFEKAKERNIELEKERAWLQHQIQQIQQIQQPFQYQEHPIPLSHFTQTQQIQQPFQYQEHPIPLSHFAQNQQLQHPVNSDTHWWIEMPSVEPYIGVGSFKTPCANEVGGNLKVNQ